MLNFLTSLWCMIGVIVGFIALFLAIIGFCAVFVEAVKKIGGK